MTSDDVMIELRALHRYFGRTKAVDDISFQVRRGQVFGYIGPNGAGKTTSMRILATLDEPTAGDAFIDGFSCIDDPDRVRRRLGYMPDYFGTYPNVDVVDYLDFFARAYGLKGDVRRRALDETMAFTKLDGLANKPVSGLSKGMRQRLSLGRTMIHDPAVLILDEPAAGLDPRARIQLREMIRRLADGGKTILVSSHILTELAEMCDTVGIIEQGRLLAVGSVGEIQREMQSVGVVQLRVLERADELAAWLAEREATNIEVDGQLIHFEHSGDVDGEAAMLRQMIESGYRVAAFGSRHKSLEDVFMQVTEGKVQ